MRVLVASGSAGSKLHAKRCVPPYRRASFLHPAPNPHCRALGTVLQVAVPPLLVAYLQGLAPLPEERRLDALPGDVASGALRWRSGGGWQELHALLCLGPIA